MRLRVKIWLEQDGGKAFGDGAADLLRRVEQVGSLRQAAVQIGMSYSQAWRLVRGLEERLGFQLLAAVAGGAAGGGSRLTERGLLWLTTYEAFRRETQAYVVGVFERHFGALLGPYDVAEPGRRQAALPPGDVVGPAPPGPRSS